MDPKIALVLFSFTFLVSMYAMGWLIRYRFGQFCESCIQFEAAHSSPWKHPVTWRLLLNLITFCAAELSLLTLLYSVVTLFLETPHV